MESKYIRECRRLMKLSHRELAVLYSLRGFAYCGKSNRRKLRMAAKLAFYKYGKNHWLNTKMQQAYNVIDKYGKYLKQIQGGG